MNNTCPSCGKQYQIGPQNIGASFACRRCGTELTVDSQGIKLSGAVQAPAASSQNVAYDPQQSSFSPLSLGDYTADSKSTFVDFLVFRRMITPWVIQIFFYLATIACFFIGLIVILTGFASRPVPGAPFYAGPVGGLCGGVMVMLLGPFVARIYAELLIVIFRINETLTDIYNLQKRNE